MKRLNPISKDNLEKRPIFWFYGSASIAYGIKNNAFSYLLLIYANQVLGLPGYLASLALALAMLWDAVSDLLLGHWSDKTSSRLGRRHPFMYAALFLLPISFYGLFNPFIELNEDNTFIYILVLAILIRTGTTLFEVPSTALLPDLESDYDRRNKWLALRYAFGWYGGNGIHTINFAFWVGAYGVAAQTGYSIYGVAGALIIASVILISALGTQKAAAAMPRPK
ncbi:MAG: MFS transporter, partial [Proteobacteria bacterium]|nr:MFS transporter [Pseudomonadota bacterium]